MSDELQSQPPLAPGEEHLQESAADIVSIALDAASVASAIGGLGGLYYQRKAYREQRSQMPDDRSGPPADYDAGFHGGNAYDPGFEGDS